MVMAVEFDLLINAVSETNGVMSVGKSGGESFSAADDGDIDIFIFCAKIPGPMARTELLHGLWPAVTDIKISENGGRFWGVCDFLTLGGSGVCLMYFNISDMDAEIESVLNGSRLEREDEYFYPTGRCATFLTMNVLFDKIGYIAGMKEKLSVYPQPLSEKLYNHHLRKMYNYEDFERAVQRGEVLFYHSVLENSIDHFLQALFALNKRFFPSRKRTLGFIEGFAVKPANCEERMLEAVELGAKADSLKQSYGIWNALCDELSGLAAETIEPPNIIC